MSDVLRLTMIIPFILQRFLTSDLLKRDVVTKIKERLNLRTHHHVVNKIIKCWVQFSLTTCKVFSRSLTNEDYIILQDMLESECRILLEVTSCDI